MASYVICSDVHGCITSLKKVVKFFSENKFDKIIILGDLLYHGPRNDIPKGYNPKAVINLLNPLKDKIIMVKGNCDAEVDQMVLDFHIFNHKKLKYMNHNIFLVHGHHLSFNNNSYKYGDVVFYGHTHVSKNQLINGVYYINPGSITIPKEQTKKSFIALVNDMCVLLDIDGNILENKKIF